MHNCRHYSERFDHLKLKMKQFLYIATLVAIVTADPIGTLDSRIIGGEEIPIEEVPYQVSLQEDGNHCCGGSIISKKFVLTAAHCIDDLDKNHLKISAGSANQKKGGSLHGVEEIIKHDNYTFLGGKIPVNDIALLKVNPPFKFDERCAPIPLYKPNEESIPESMAIISGWGITETTRNPIYLRATKVPIMSRKKCKEAYERLVDLPEGQICAADPEGGKDACQNDSGGPLAIDGRLAGIVSWGSGCGLKGSPGVYTEVAYYSSWIAENTRL